jgi:hypothetical protein
MKPGYGEPVQYGNLCQQAGSVTGTTIYLRRGPEVGMWDV